MRGVQRLRNLPRGGRGIATFRLAGELEEYHNFYLSSVSFLGLAAAAGARSSEKTPRFITGKRAPLS